MTDNNDNIEVILTDPHEFHCFKVVFHVKPSPDAIQRVPLEIFLHTTQAIDLLQKLSLAVCEKHRQDSAELLAIRLRVLTPEERERILGEGLGFKT